MLGPADSQIGMVICVITDLMSLCYNPSNDIWVSLSVGAHEEECCLNMTSFKDVENFWSPLRIGSIVERQRHVMRAACTLMVQGRELWEFNVGVGEIFIVIDGQVTHSIRTAFIDRDDFAFADVGNGIGSAQSLEERSGSGVNPEVGRYAQRVPDRRVLSPEAVQRKPSSFLSPHLAQLV